MTSQPTVPTKLYEEKASNFEEIPLPSRRTQEEVEILEYLDLREDVEKSYKEIRQKKRRIEELISENQAISALDKQLKKKPKELEEERIEKKRRRVPTSLEKLEEKEAKEARKRIKNAKKKKIDQHKSYLRQGYTMTEEEITKEGGEVEKQYVYFKDLGEGRKKTHVMKGLQGLKLSSQLGEHDQEMLFSD